MIKFVDDFLNGITMYRLILYVLIFLVTVASFFSFFKFLPFDPLNIIFSTVFSIASCWIANRILAKIFKAPTNLESVYVTALILTLIITPAHNLQSLLFLGLAGVLSQASKYIIVYSRKHIFNPAAFSVVLLMPFIGSASWWVGTAWMAPFVFVGGLLIVRKIRKFSLVLAFFSIAFIINPSLINQTSFLETPVLFFAFIMLTEPQTTPPKVLHQLIYGSLVGILYATRATPEIALLLGNMFAFIVSPKGRLILKLKEKIKIAPDIYDFVFGSNKKLPFVAGQYLEWTLPHNNSDSRGVRRFFTVAASPTEDNLRIGVKFYPQGSSFKKRLLELENEGQIAASCLAGDFVLPSDEKQKLCFIAGGIGITPFRSMVKLLLDINQSRDIVLLYASKDEKDFVYKNIFDKAFEKLKMKTIYVASEKGRHIDAALIQKEVPDYKSRIFYISGPHSLVDAFEVVLKNMGLSGSQIKVDFFPGYA